MQVSRFLRETLEAYASETVADDVLRTALGLAGLSSLPTTSLELRDLIDRHLVATSTALMGAETAEAVRQRLQPLLVVVEQIEVSQQRPTRPPEGPAEPLETPLARARPDAFDDRTPTREIELKPFSVVLVLGHDPDAATQLKAQVDSRTAVIPVEEPRTLLRDLKLLRAQARMLIVDLRKPHALLEAVRPDAALLEHAVVVLWGASRELDADTKRAFPMARVVRCGPDASVGDLAAIVRLGPGR